MSKFLTVSELIQLEQDVRIECFAGKCVGHEILDLEAIQERRGKEFMLETRMHLWRCPRCGERQGRPYVSAKWAGKARPDR